ncbi:MAG: radical SAM family heme chaperone HemW [Ignavibacteriales bacterium]|nr:MAG: radical SAM family heme chaperone HemW [Ignavibacteriales bacterium]
MKESALYIHIPFCDHKCIYCDFYSIITSDNINNFLSSVKKEIQHYSRLYSVDRNFTSIFFGGGTPSLMKPEYISEIMNELSKNFSVTGDAEITLETNPGTVDKEKLKAFYSSGINRISIGIQSFKESDLKFLTRIHDRKTAIDTVNAAAEAGFNNISIDLIFNLSGQTKQLWLENLKQAVSLPVKHISAYSLILERGTILNKMVIDGKVTIQDEDHDADLYESTIDLMESKGFHQYEVSNFALDGFECRHNKAYWRYKDYLSFGPSAHSFVNGKRWWNFSSLKKYISEIDNKGNAVSGHEEPDANQQFEEYIMLALRSNGIDKIEMSHKFGEGWLKTNRVKLNQLSQNNFLMEDDNYIKLTKYGYAVCDEIIKNFD